MMNDDIFEKVISLPNSAISSQAKRLVGFTELYDEQARTLRLLLDKAGVEKWSKKHHGSRLPVCDALNERHQLVIFSGDVGTGKTVTAEAVANKLTEELRVDGCLLKLSTRVRGKGVHGEMSELLHGAFDRLIEETGKKRIACLLIDEADALAAKRSTQQMHHEEKAAVNTLIQKLDDLRRLGGRALVILCTNRIGALDQAIVRRAGTIVEFLRPNDAQRLEVLEMDLQGVGLTHVQMKKLVKLTGPGPKGDIGAGFTFSDLRLRLVPNAVARVFPERPLDAETLFAAADSLTASPEISDDR